MTAVKPLRVLVADDERPARRFLVDILATCNAVELAAEASSGEEAVRLIRDVRPDLALLDLQMPELSGLDVVRRLHTPDLPIVAFVTAFDEFAIEAFELNAIDYLLKPVERARLQATLDRTRARLGRSEPIDQHATHLNQAIKTYEQAARRQFLDRLPVRNRDEVLIVSVRQIASVVADGELLHITTTTNERHTITHRLHALEARLDPRRFARLSRGTLINLDTLVRLTAMPGGTYIAQLSNGQQLPVSRIQSRVLRDTVLRF